MTTYIRCWSCGYLVHADNDICPECGSKLDNYEVKKEEER